ncbi:MAG: FMN-binding glutamate synthase family protein [Sphingomonadales bacterium]|nr:FMN-binding glutamate synthase family protein [Sphingomonadales bacterium]
MSRYYALFIVLFLTIALFALGYTVSIHFFWAAGLFALFSMLGIRDVLQRHHSILKNYPIIGHMRWILEMIRPELRQYLFSSDTEETPFNREQRSLVYQRSKLDNDKVPYGTKANVYESGHEWINHSIAPCPVSDEACHTIIGGKDCAKPYKSSVLNISAMSYGALSGNAIQALNRGAKQGGFAHDTGEGSISRYHRAEGGDLIWELGTGYFGCRNAEGGFSPEAFKDQATNDQVKMIEIKVSQGAKPGHGGILPAAKLTKEIAEARMIPMGQDVISPASHSAFSTPLEMMHFIAQLRELSGGKPVGFKMCIGHKWEFMAILKAMIETGIKPDFIVIDGSEGGTGAAPIEFANHIGTPLVEGLQFVCNALTGAGLRDGIKVGASGKVVSAFDMIRLFSIGADFTNSARAFMMALGCIQSLSCHNNNCPTGIATQDKLRQRSLNVKSKAIRVKNFHNNTIHALQEVLSASGVSGPAELRHIHFNMRDGDGYARGAEENGPWLIDGELLAGTKHKVYARSWARASAETFKPEFLHY